MNYYGFSYDVIEVSPLTRKEIRKLDDVTKVSYLFCFVILARIYRTPLFHFFEISIFCSLQLPTVFAQVDRKLSDSSLIISILASYLVQEDRCLDEIIELYPEQRTIVKETGKQMVIHPNMYEIMTTVNGWSSKKEQEDARSSFSNLKVLGCFQIIFFYLLLRVSFPNNWLERILFSFVDSLFVELLFVGLRSRNYNYHLKS